MDTPLHLWGCLHYTSEYTHMLLHTHTHTHTECACVCMYVVCAYVEKLKSSCKEENNVASFTFILRTFDFIFKRQTSKIPQYRRKTNVPKTRKPNPEKHSDLGHMTGLSVRMNLLISLIAAYLKRFTL